MLLGKSITHWLMGSDTPELFSGCFPIMTLPQRSLLNMHSRCQLPFEEVWDSSEHLKFIWAPHTGFVPPVKSIHEYGMNMFVYLKRLKVLPLVASSLNCINNPNPIRENQCNCLFVIIFQLCYLDQYLQCEQSVLFSKTRIVHPC